MALEFDGFESLASDRKGPGYLRIDARGGREIARAA